MEHDSHEFLLYFLNQLKDEMTEKGSKLPTDSSLSVDKLWKQFSQTFKSFTDQKFTLIERTAIMCTACGKQ